MFGMLNLIFNELKIFQLEGKIETKSILHFYVRCLRLLFKSSPAHIYLNQVPADLREATKSGDPLFWIYP